MPRSPRLNIRLNVVNFGDEKNPSIQIVFGEGRNIQCLLHGRHIKDYDEPFIRAMISIAETEEELEDLAESAFELGRRFERKYGKRFPQRS
jgi:hypothetical protein